MRLKFVIIICLAVQPLLIHTLLWATSPHTTLTFQPDGWTAISHEAGFVLEAQSIKDHQLQAYRAKGILNAPIDQILEVLSDVSAAAEWIPGLASKQVVSEVSTFELITLSVYAVPFPFSDREFLLHNHLRLDRERGALMAEAVSIDRPEVPVDGGRVRAHMYSCQTWLRPLSTDRTEVEFTLMVEPRGKLPDFLADFGIRRMPLKLLKALQNRAQHSDYTLRLAYRDMLMELVNTSHSAHHTNGRGQYLPPSNPPGKQ